MTREALTEIGIVDYSYSELMKVYDKVRQSVINGTSTDIAGSYVDVMNNCVCMFVVEINSEKEAAFRSSATDSPAVKLEYTDDFAKLDTEAELDGHTDARK